jgi:WS/DGAT/MGAT family acyltransferase
MFGTERERISSVDVAWLRMDRPYNLMMISAVMVLDDRLTLGAVRKVMETRFLRHNRFKQRVIHNPGGAYYWEKDEHFDIASHVRRIGLPGAGGKKELEEVVGDLMSTPLDPSKPLWQVHLVENYQGGSAGIFRFHHCYADGIALIHVLLSMTETQPHGSADTSAGAMPRTAHHHERHDIGESLFHHFFEPIGWAVNHAVKAGVDLVEEGMELITHPRETVDFARHGVGMAFEAVRLLAMRDDPQTSFKGDLGVAKCVAWSEPMPLSEVKAVGSAMGCSVNDVLLSSVAGALRYYLAERRHSLDALDIRATVPVNLRPLDQVENLGNYFGLVFLELPIGIENPVERLFVVKQRMDELKGSYQAILALGLLGVLGLGPKLLQSTVLKTLSKKATAVMTNVPGPQVPLYFAGAKIREQMFWVPQSGTIGMGVSILTYNGQVQFGLATTKKLVSDPQAIVERFSVEFERLLLSVMMGPWID